MKVYEYTFLEIVDGTAMGCHAPGRADILAE